jgi:hypothetical protein
MHKRQRRNRLTTLRSTVLAGLRWLVTDAERRRLDAWCAAITADLAGRPWYMAGS